jgi:hypothetical protein
VARVIGKRTELHCRALVIDSENPCSCVRCVSEHGGTERPVDLNDLKNLDLLEISSTVDFKAEALSRTATARNAPRR